MENRWKTYAQSMLEEVVQKAQKSLTIEPKRAQHSTTNLEKIRFNKLPKKYLFLMIILGGGWGGGPPPPSPPKFFN